MTIRVFPPSIGNGGTKYEGMSLRDHFAGLAMEAVLQRTDPVCETHFNNIAKDAYRMADAMLKQRSLTNA